MMYQHQHAPLPLELLKDVPQPVVVLLEKDPAQRFQTPNELLKAVAAQLVAKRRTCHSGRNWSSLTTSARSLLTSSFWLASFGARRV